MAEEKNFKTLSIIIPVYNENSTINKLLDRVIKEDVNFLEKEIIVVDDGSTDGTRDKLKSLDIPNVKVFMHEKNQGKGAALHTGFAHSTGDIIIIQDADLEYNPKDYNDLIAPILDNQADVVYGSRFIGDKPHRVLYFSHYFINKGITFISDLFTDLNLTDIETCYKVFTRKVLDSIKLKEKRFGFEPEFTAKIAKKKFRVYEVGISYTGRDYSEGKKIGFKDGVRTIWCIFKYNLFSK